MAKRMTDTANLALVANAIRAKGGTSAQLVYPAGFVSAIQAIQTGITPKLVVTTSAGAAVTAAKGSKTVTGTAGTDGTCTLELPEAGEWSVSASLNGSTKTQTVSIGTQSMLLPLIELEDTFAANSWETIIAACQAGFVPDTWAVGDSKPMAINGTNYQIDIIGKNHDVYADGSGKAPLTFQLHDCYGTQYNMNSTATTVGGWKSSAMRLTHLPALLALMPSAVQSGIREVSKKATTGNKSETIETVSDKLFLLSEIEVFNTTTYSAAGEGSQYAYYTTEGRTIKYLNGKANGWWLRSQSIATNVCFCVTVDTGAIYDVAAQGTRGVSFAFCF